MSANNISEGEDATIKLLMDEGVFRKGMTMEIPFDALTGVVREAKQHAITTIADMKKFLVDCASAIKDDTKNIYVEDDILYNVLYAALSQVFVGTEWKSVPWKINFPGPTNSDGSAGHLPTNIFVTLPQSLKKIQVFIHDNKKDVQYATKYRHDEQPAAIFVVNTRNATVAEATYNVENEQLVRSIFTA